MTRQRERDMVDRKTDTDEAERETWWTGRLALIRQRQGRDSDTTRQTERVDRQIGTDKTETGQRQ